MQHYNTPRSQAEDGHQGIIENWDPAHLDARHCHSKPFGLYPTLPSPWVTPSAPKWKGASTVNASSIFPIASMLQSAVTIGVAAGHDLTGSAWCSKSYYRKATTSPRSFSGFIFQDDLNMFSISSHSAQKLSAPFPVCPRPNFPVLTISLSQWGHSVLSCFSYQLHSFFTSALLNYPSCAYFQRFNCQSDF